MLMTQLRSARAACRQNSRIMCSKMTTRTSPSPPSPPSPSSSSSSIASTLSHSSYSSAFALETTTSKVRAFHTTAFRLAAEDPLKADLKAKGIPIPANMPPSKDEFLASLDEETKKLEKLTGGPIVDADGFSPTVKKVGDLLINLTVFEANQLTKYMQKKLGLPEGMGMSMGGMGGGMPMGGGMGMPAQQAQPAAAQPAQAQPAAKEEPKVEKTEFNIKLEKFAQDKKLQIIKELRVANKDLGIKEAKELVESAPCILLKNLKKEDANKWKAKFEELGGTISLE